MQLAGGRSCAQARHAAVFTSNTRPTARIRRPHTTVTLSSNPDPARGASSAAAPSERLAYDHLLLTILDSNPELSSSSWQAVATAADLAALHKGRVTVLVVDEKVSPGEGKMKHQASKIASTLSQLGVPFNILERSVVGDAAKDAEGRSSVVLGEVADEVEADLLVLHSQAVHNKEVDANLLAEFVSCPVLLLP